LLLCGLANRELLGSISNFNWKVPLLVFVDWTKLAFPFEKAAEPNASLDF